MSEKRSRPGWVEAATRIVQVALGSPRIKRALDTVLNYLDPDYAPKLVDVALHTDPELPHATLQALPDGLNIGIEVFGALVREATNRPTALIAEAISGLKARLRVHTLGEAVGSIVATAVALRTEPSRREGDTTLVRELLDGLTTGLRRAGVPPGAAAGTLAISTAETVLSEIERQLGRDPDLAGQLADLSSELSRLLERHPETVEKVVAPLLGPLLAAAQRQPRGAS